MEKEIEILGVKGLNQETFSKQKVTKMSLTRRIRLTINAFNVGNHNSFILMVLMNDSAVLL